MARLRSNFQRGSLTGSITSGATSISSGEFSALPVVASPDFLIIVLDPDAVHGNPELIKVTAHSSSATSITATRGVGGTTARSHNPSVEWRHVSTAAGDFGPDLLASDYLVSTSASAATNNAGLTSAIADAGSAARRRIALDTGVFNITGLSGSDKTFAVKGQGHRTSTLRADGTTHAFSAVHATELTGYVFEDFAVSFSPAQTTYDCINFGNNVTMFSLSRVATASGRHGLHTAGTCDVATVHDCVFGSTNVAGWYGDTGTANVSVSDCWFNENTTFGIYLNGVDCTICGCRFSDTGTGIRLDASAARNTISGCTFGLTASGSGGIEVYGDDNVIVGNFAGNHAFIDIVVKSGASRNVIVGNSCGASGDIVLDSGSSNNIVVGNRATVTDNGTSNTVANNA